ncbi:hypothetical protein ACWOET_16175 [Enterococcus caccae]|nr:hypothetical protein RU98_GL000970 [Enterococcus caccae]
MWLLKAVNNHDNDAWSKQLCMIPIFENLQQKESIEKCYVGYNNNLSDEDQEYARKFPAKNHLSRVLFW